MPFSSVIRPSARKLFLPIFPPGSPAERSLEILSARPVPVPSEIPLLTVRRFVGYAAKSTSVLQSMAPMCRVPYPPVMLLVHHDCRLPVVVNAAAGNVGRRCTGALPRYPMRRRSTLRLGQIHTPFHREPLSCPPLALSPAVCHLRAHNGTRVSTAPEAQRRTCDTDTRALFSELILLCASRNA